MNQRIVLLLSFFSILFINVYSQKSELNWQSSPTIIDGNDNDWNPVGKKLRFYDSKNQLYYDLRNDSTNLYFVLKSDNPFLQHQISFGGMKLTLIIKEKPKRTTVFVLEPKKGMSKRFSQQKREKSLDELARKEEIMPKDTAFLDGFQCTKGNILSGNTNSNEFSFDISKGRKASKTVFELLIPIRDLFGNGFNLNQISQIPIQLQLTINAPSGNSNFGQMRGGMGRKGGMGGPGGEMGEGQQGSRPEGTQAGNTMEKKDMKFEFYLTNKN